MKRGVVITFYKKGKIDDKLHSGIKVRLKILFNKFESSTG